MFMAAQSDNYSSYPFGDDSKGPVFGVISKSKAGSALDIGKRFQQADHVYIERVKGVRAKAQEAVEQ